MNIHNSQIRESIENLINLGSCIKIKNSDKTFQVIGLNKKNNICWIREWPLKHSSNKTFELSVNKIINSTICPNISFKGK